jgi:heavy metal sensor kinase
MTKKIGATPKLHLGTLLHSVRFRLVLWFTVILAIILFAFSTFLFYTQSRNLQAEAVRELDRRVTSLLQFVQSGMSQGMGQISLPQGLLRDTDVFLIVSPDGQVLASQGPIPARQVLQILSAGLQSNSQAGEGSVVYWTSTSSQNYLFIPTQVHDHMGVDIVVIFGGILDPGALVNRFLFTLIIGSLLTLLIAVIGGFWLADRVMRPVKTITQAARAISETDLSLRLNLKNKDELGELANTFDAMLARLQAAFERQRQFVADASHELRTPLTIVNLETSRALETHRSQPEYQHALKIIHAENDFMTSLVNDLLVLARMDAGQTAMEKNPLDLSDLVVDTIERLTPLAVRNGVTLQAGNLPETYILGDRQYLLQMLSNLVENAIKYTTGDKKLVSAETGSSDGITWVRVSDTGPGIATEDIPHLFERFYRVDKARTRDTELETDPNLPSGSGLGLSIVQWIVQAHGGEIHLESTPGSGSTFEVRFKTP